LQTSPAGGAETGVWDLFTPAKATQTGSCVYRGLKHCVLQGLAELGDSAHTGAHDLGRATGGGSLCAGMQALWEPEEPRPNCFVHETH
jgi:hypothetical protein